MPILIVLVGLKTDSRLMNKLIKLWIVTAPIQALYEIRQFLFAPFGFEKSFMETKSSISAWYLGSFTRAIPLYDNIEVLFVQFAIAFVFLLSGKKTGLSRIAMFLILVATVMTGDRGGILLILMTVVLYYLFCTEFRYQKAITVGFIVITLFSLNIFGAVLMKFIDRTSLIQLGSSYFAQRLGTLGTFGDRIIGRQIAFAHLTILGKGFGSSGLVADALLNKGLGVAQQAPTTFAHDIVGELILDLGIAGLGLFLWLLFRVGKLSFRRPEYAALASIIFGSFLTSALLGSAYTFGRSGYFIFLIAGFILSTKEFKYVGARGNIWHGISRSRRVFASTIKSNM